MSHPNSLDLEAFACGEEAAAIGEHLATCEACTSFVAKLRGLAAPRAEIVTRAVRSHRNRNVLAAASVAIPLAVAALVLFLVRTPETAPDRTVTPPAPIAQNDPEPETAFKGGVQVAVIRERAGSQQRFTSAVSVRPGDRLRVEVALDREQTILAAVVGEDGSWLELMRSDARGRGTHLSERSAKVDAHPLRGTILVGPPAAIERARATKNLDGVSTIRVEWEATP